MSSAAYQHLKTDPRVYAQRDTWYGLKRFIGSKNSFPAFTVAHNLSGNYLSTQRGRGLNFEELRHYQQGDEVRHMDWKITLRTGKPHVRAYSEEKEQNIFVCIDQRESMFFSSVDTMKSVAGANIAAFCMWQATKNSDRLGALIMQDERCDVFPFKKGERHVDGILQHLHRCNHQLGGDTKKVNSTQSLLTFFLQLQQKKIHNSTIIIISDWYGLNTQTSRLLQYLQKQNRIIAVQLTDPVEQSIEAWKGVNISDGTDQIELCKHAALSDDALKQYNEETNQQQEALSRLVALTGVALIPITTDGHEIATFSRHFL